MWCKTLVVNPGNIPSLRTRLAGSNSRVSELVEDMTALCSALARETCFLQFGRRGFPEPAGVNEIELPIVRTKNKRLN
jgi:hypothetical protein